MRAWPIRKQHLMQIFWGSPLAKFGMTRKERKIQIGEIRHNADHFRLHQHLLSKDWDGQAAAGRWAAKQPRRLGWVCGCWHSWVHSASLYLNALLFASQTLSKTELSATPAATFNHLKTHANDWIDWELWTSWKKEKKNNPKCIHAPFSHYNPSQLA